jgi:hypothetical protein
VLLAASASVLCASAAFAIFQLTRILFSVVRDSEYEADKLITAVSATIHSDSPGGLLIVLLSLQQRVVRWCVWWTSSLCHSASSWTTAQAVKQLCFRASLATMVPLQKSCAQVLIAAALQLTSTREQTRSDVSTRSSCHTCNCISGLCCMYRRQQQMCGHGRPATAHDCTRIDGNCVCCQLHLTHMDGWQLCSSVACRCRCA